MTRMCDARLREALLSAARRELGAAWDGREAMAPGPGFGDWEADFLSRCAGAAQRRGARRALPRRRMLLLAAAAVLLLAGCTAAVVTSPAVQETVRKVFPVTLVSNPRLSMEPEVHTDSEGNFYSVTQEWTLSYSDGSELHLFAFAWREDGLNTPLDANELLDYPDRQWTEFDPNPPDVGEWDLGWLPEGFEREEKESSSGNREVSYRREDGAYLNFGFKSVTERGSTFVLRDGSAVETEEINGVPAYIWQFYNEENSCALHWADQETGVAYYINSAGVQRDELLQIAESIAPAAG